MTKTINRFDSTATDFEGRFSAFIEEKREAAPDVAATVSEILVNVRKSGDEAVLSYTEKFDRQSLTADDLQVSAEEIEAALAACAPAQLEALKFAADRIRAFHERQRPADLWTTDDKGVSLGYRWTAIDAVGLYVPGGSAAYPSSVLMNAVPAQVAGVERITMVSPTPGGGFNPLVLAAAREAGVSEIYRVGGAQAVGALAFGTQTIKPVDKIVGPGNAYVAEAKRLVFGVVGIDMIAGPSEILVVADAANDPAWVATDLLSQAEHDVSSQSILITDDEGFAARVEEALKLELAELGRANTARESLSRFGAIVLVGDLMRDAPALVDRIAAEHVEIATAEPQILLEKIKHAGAIFLGRHTPEAVGDYVAGTNHVLPTGRSARFSSGLSVLDFMKRSSIVSCTADSLGAIGWAAAELADAEGLGAHARSVRIRSNKT